MTIEKKMEKYKLNSFLVTDRLLTGWGCHIPLIPAQYLQVWDQAGLQSKKFCLQKPEAKPSTTNKKKHIIFM